MVQKYTALEIAAITLSALMLISGCVQQKQQGEKNRSGRWGTEQDNPRRSCTSEKKTKW